MTGTYQPFTPSYSGVNDVSHVPMIPMLTAPTPLTDPTSRHEAEARARARMAPQVAEISKAEREEFLRGLRLDAATAPNELVYRKAIGIRLAEKNYAAPLRRALMGEAIAVFRAGATSTRPAPRPMEKSVPRGGSYYARIPKPGGKHEYVYSEAEYKQRPDAHIDGKSAQDAYLHHHVARILDRHADPDANGGVPIGHFRGLVERHGHQAIARALKTHKVAFDGTHVHRKRSAGGSVSKALPFPAPDSVPGGRRLTGTGHPNPNAVPPGTRRVWHNRIVEKVGTGGWKVVGHIAGLEAKRPPPLETRHLTPEEAHELLEKIRAHVQAEERK